MKVTDRAKLASTKLRLCKMFDGLKGAQISTAEPSYTRRSMGLLRGIYCRDFCKTQCVQEDNTNG